MGMIDRLIEASLRRRLLVLVGVLLLVGFGVWSFLRLPIDAFPDVTNIQVEVLSERARACPRSRSRSSSPIPIEMTLRGLPRLTQLRSVSKFGLSVVTVVFEDGVDIYFARQLVLERLIEARDKVPTGSRSPWARSRRPWARSTSTPSKGPMPADESGQDRLPDRAADDPGLDPGAPSSSPSPASARSTPSADTSSSIQVVVDPGQAPQVRPDPGRRGRSPPPEQPQRRRQRPPEPRPAVHRPGHRPPPVGRGHRARSSSRPRAARPSSLRDVAEAAVRPGRPPGRARSRTAEANASAAWS